MKTYSAHYSQKAPQYASHVETITRKLQATNCKEAAKLARAEKPQGYKFDNIYLDNDRTKLN